jgi:hypothetical protein
LGHFCTDEAAIGLIKYWQDKKTIIEMDDFTYNPDEDDFDE